MHWRDFFIPTTKETPKDATAPSHKLMLRAGLIRQVAAGVYSYLPLGYRVLRKVENIVREEMNRAGAIELHLPVLQPLSWWEETGRVEALGDVLLRLGGPRGDWRSQTVLGPTHEEVITEIARAHLNSYKQLPVNLYQIQVKFRGEARPKSGVLRTREFLMKDAYSFDADKAGLDASYQKMYDAYCRLFSRCGLPYVVCEAESGPIGGDASHEFMVLTEAGEDQVVLSEKGDYAANLERASGAPLPAQMIKTLIYAGTETRRHEGTKGKTARVVALVRGDHDVNQNKLNRAAGMTLELADAPTIEELTGAAVGFAGPRGLAQKADKLIIDRDVASLRNAASGANKTDYHITGVNPGRDFPLEGENVIVADIRDVVGGDPSPTGDGSKLRIETAIEIGHVFKLGTKYSDAMGATFLTKEGKPQPLVMGCYGIGLNRIVAAAIEAHHDDNGIIWPMSIAPFEVLVLALDPRDDEVMKTATDIHERLAAAGVDVLFDDRNERAGFKFKDADLIGVPVRVIVGKRGLKDGMVELSHRRDDAKQKFPPQEIVEQAVTLVREESARLA